jgi:POT family proton-dependent oligopeptide transporter
MRARRREPSSASKIASGLFVSALSLVVMAAAGLLGGNRDQAIMSPWWLVSSYFLMALGEILFSPMGLSFVSRVAPARIRGLIMGFWFGATAVGSYSSGLLGRLYGEMAHHRYFLLVAGLLLVGAALALVSRRRLGRFAA